MLKVSEIKKLIKRRGYTIPEFAEKIGYSYTGFHKALNNNTLSFQAIKKLSRELNINIEDIYEENDLIANEAIPNYRQNEDFVKIFNEQLKFLTKQIEIKDDQIKFLQHLIEEKLK